MRRSDRLMEAGAAMELLEKGMYGVLSTVDDSNQPYGVPLSYAVSDNKKEIYFHGAQTGHKLDNIKMSSKACFTVVGNTKLLPEKFSTEYESVIVFGNAKLVEGEEKIEALKAVIKKYSADYLKEGDEYIARAAANTATFKLTIEDFTGKSRTEA
jgi:nitroimidazol reductase NimA-like FMN-containing flavoprotein (pyridoxamine 5'-phosphate oxidase superfamily)